MTDWITPVMFGGLLTAVVAGGAVAAMKGGLNPAGRGLAILAATAAGGVAVQLLLAAGRGVQVGSWIAGAADAPGVVGTEVLFLMAGGACLLAAVAMAAMIVSAGVRLRSVEGMRALLAVQAVSMTVQLLLVAGLAAGLEQTGSTGAAVAVQLSVTMVAALFAFRAFVSMYRYGLLDADPVRLPARRQQPEMVPARS